MNTLNDQLMNESEVKISWHKLFTEELQMEKYLCKIHNLYPDNLQSEEIKILN